VVKLGGSVLRDGVAIRKAAEQLKLELRNGNRVVAVVSAIKGTTDKLLNISDEISSDIPSSVIDEIIRLGEEQSARLLTATLKLIGVDAVEITPDSPSWPIITNEVFGNAEPLMDHCRQAVSLGIKPLIERGQLPVVCGFIGRSLSGKITTLGRGGTDTTATIIAECLGADQLILVKDVGGIFSADPKKVDDAVFINSMDADEASIITASGSRVLQDKVFKYKSEELDIRIVSEDGPLNKKGTIIIGSAIDLAFYRYTRPVHKMTIVGHDCFNFGLFTNLIQKLNGINLTVHSSSITDKSISLIVEGDISKIIQKVHGMIKNTQFTAVTSRDNLARFKIYGTKVNQNKNDIVELLTEINYLHLELDDVSITFIVPWNERFNTEEQLKKPNFSSIINF
jgi:aspartate kinase